MKIKKFYSLWVEALGSKKLNSIIRENLDALLQQYQVIHLTGKGLKDAQVKKSGYIQYEFVKEI